MTVPPRILSIDPPKCDGCGNCELACALKHTGDKNPAKSRIRVISGDKDRRFFLPTSCQHCENPPCMAVCPNDAIYRDPILNRVLIRQEHCVGCRMCVAACPFGAIGFDAEQGCSFKCDLCEGSPECVRVCETRALEYIADHRLNQVRACESAQKQYQVIRRLVA